MRIGSTKRGQWNLAHAYLVTAAIVLTLLAGCGGETAGGAPPVTLPAPAPGPAPAPTPTPTPRPASVEREISPPTVDPAVSASNGNYVAINPDPAETPRGRLFVMLPGTGAVPRFYRGIARTGAARGYHSIGLAYPNDTAVGDLCAGIADPDCTGNTRQEIITGESVSALVTVNSANAITGRLTALLAYLDRTYPTEGWGQYLRAGTVDWSLVTVAGHSQGSGHAAYMAKLYSLNRTVMFSGPADVPATGGLTARWLSLPNVTPASRQYGFTHVDDELVPFSLVRTNWTGLGLDAPGGAAFSVDGMSAPFGNSHQLSTRAAAGVAPGPITLFPFHSATVADVVTPANAQARPLFEPVWIYLAFP